MKTKLNRMPVKWLYLLLLVCMANISIVLNNASAVVVVNPYQGQVLDRPPHLTVSVKDGEHITAIDIYQGFPGDPIQFGIAFVEVPEESQGPVVNISLDTGTDPIFMCGEYVLYVTTRESGSALSGYFILMTDLAYIRAYDYSDTVTTNNGVDLEWVVFGQPWHTNFWTCIEKDDVNCDTSEEFDPGLGSFITGTNVTWNIPETAPVGFYWYMVKQLDNPSNYGLGAFKIDRRGTLPPTLTLTKNPSTNSYILNAVINIPDEPSLQFPGRTWYYEYCFNLAGQDTVWYRFNVFPLPLGAYELNIPDWVQTLFIRAVEVTREKSIVL